MPSSRNVAAELAADRGALASSQTLDRLGDVLTIEAVIGDRHRAQDRRLIEGPGVEILVVT
jgi:hypothetical protein